jgi:quercetin dioxygenase-like cupin family protein
VAYVLQGAIEVVMDDGARAIFRKGDIIMVPPGHDAWAVGNEPCVFIQFSQGDNYYDALTAEALKGK